MILIGEQHRARTTLKTTAESQNQKPGVREPGVIEFPSTFLGQLRALVSVPFIALRLTASQLGEQDCRQDSEEDKQPRPDVLNWTIRRV